MNNPILALCLGIIMGLSLIIGGVLFIKKSKKFIKTEGECSDCYYGIKTRISVVDYKFKNNEYKMQKHIPFSEVGSKYKIKVNPEKPDKAYCWYDTFLSYECIVLGVVFIIATFINHL